MVQQKVRENYGVGNVEIEANHTNAYWIGVKEYRARPTLFTATKGTMTSAVAATEVALGTLYKKSAHSTILTCATLPPSFEFV